MFYAFLKKYLMVNLLSSCKETKIGGPDHFWLMWQRLNNEWNLISSEEILRFIILSRITNNPIAFPYVCKMQLLVPLSNKFPFIKDLFVVTNVFIALDINRQ